MPQQQHAGADRPEGGQPKAEVLTQRPAHEAVHRLEHDRHRRVGCGIGVCGDLCEVGDGEGPACEAHGLYQPGEDPGGGRTELSFNLARPAEVWWFLFSLAMMMGAALCVASMMGVVRRSKMRPIGVALTAVVTTALLAVAVLAVDPQPDLGSGLAPDVTEDLPIVALANYGFGIRESDIGGDRLQVRLGNETDLPHTFSIDALDLDVYVPAGREAIVDVALPNTNEPLSLYCAIGDHADRGMTATLDSNVRSG